MNELIKIYMSLTQKIAQNNIDIGIFVKTLDRSEDTGDLPEKLLQWLDASNTFRQALDTIMMPKLMSESNKKAVDNVIEDVNNKDISQKMITQQSTTKARTKVVIDFFDGTTPQIVTWCMHYTATYTWDMKHKNGLVLYNVRGADKYLKYFSLMIPCRIRLYPKLSKEKSLILQEDFFGLTSEDTTLISIMPGRFVIRLQRQTELQMAELIEDQRDGKGWKFTYSIYEDGVRK